MKRPERLVELVQFLGGRRPKSFREIVQRFGVSERTAYRDLSELGRIAPVTRDEHGYRLLETAQEPPVFLTAAERLLLHLALDNPALTRRRPLARILDGLRQKLASFVPPGGAESPLRLAGVDRTGEGADAVIEEVARAAEGRRPVDIHYASLSGKSRHWRGVDPYVVFERAGAWYVAGRCHRRDDTLLFRLDRVEEVRPLAGGFEMPQSFDLADFLGSTWTVFRGTERHDIELEADADLAPLLENARHHSDEEVERLADGSLRYRVRLSSLEEIARWVLGFGGKVRVVEPPELQARVEEIASGFLAAAARPRRV